MAHTAALSEGELEATAFRALAAIAADPAAPVKERVTAAAMLLQGASNTRKLSLRASAALAASRAEAIAAAKRGARERRAAAVRARRRRAKARRRTR